MNNALVLVAVVLVSTLSACSVETSSCGPSGCTSSRSGSFSNQPVGGSCANDGECAGSMLCDTEAPNGYCLQLGCSSSSGCPSGGVCVSGTRSNFCAKGCSSSSDCRPGYVCSRFTNSNGGWCTTP
ncbi:MAG: hypothetical protein SFW67_01710 [Myxococcaceae bacterium]|nr:hypothetical protein [Myxococcaceae bacterium]